MDNRYDNFYGNNHEFEQQNKTSNDMDNAYNGVPYQDASSGGFNSTDNGVNANASEHDVMSEQIIRPDTAQNQSMNAQQEQQSQYYGGIINQDPSGNQTNTQFVQNSAPFANGTGYTQENSLTVVPQQKKKAKKKANRKFSLVQLVASILVTAVLCTTFMSLAVNSRIDSIEDKYAQVNATTANSNTPNVQNTSTDSNTYTAVADKVSPSVVGIRVTTSVQNMFFGTSDSSDEGSGVIYTSDGYIITNYHVISGAVEASSSQNTMNYFNRFGETSASTSKIEVFLAANSDISYEAEIIGYDASVDLAVIKIDAENLTPISIGNSDNLQIGDVVVAVGNPGGLEFMGSVSQGIISGLNRSITTETGTEMNLIQTDAAINPGNSGGALCDMNGNLIGINNSKMAGDGYEGMGFSIPVNTVVDICDSIIQKKDEPQPYLGIMASSEYTYDVLRSYGLPGGVLVASCVTGSPAEDAGIQAYDIITEFNGIQVTSLDQMNSEKNKLSVGDVVQLTIFRSGEYYTVNVTLGATIAQ